MQFRIMVGGFVPDEEIYFLFDLGLLLYPDLVRNSCAVSDEAKLFIADLRELPRAF